MGLDVSHETDEEIEHLSAQSNYVQPFCAVRTFANLWSIRYPIKLIKIIKHTNSQTKSRHRIPRHLSLS